MLLSKFLFSISKIVNRQENRVNTLRITLKSIGLFSLSFLFSITHVIEVNVVYLLSNFFHQNPLENGYSCFKVNFFHLEHHSTYSTHRYVFQVILMTSNLLTQHFLITANINLNLLNDRHIN